VSGVSTEGKLKRTGESQVAQHVAIDDNSAQVRGFRFCSTKLAGREATFLGLS